MNCKNCDHSVNLNYCPNCGQAVNLKRISGKYIIHEIEHVLHFERGILFTIKELLINPGQNIKNYLTENRNRLVKPILFIIVTSLIYMVCANIFHFTDGYISYIDNQKTTTGAIMKWVQLHLGYSNIIMGICIALWTKLFFKKHDYNLFEVLILLCFVMGMGMLIYSIFGIIQGLTHANIVQYGGIVGLIYTTWAVGNFYDKRKIAAYVKSFFAYILGMLTFSVLMILTGAVIDVIIKH